MSRWLLLREGRGGAGVCISVVGTGPIFLLNLVIPSLLLAGYGHKLFEQAHVASCLLLQLLQVVIGIRIIPARSDSTRSIHTGILHSGSISTRLFSTVLIL